MTRGDDLSRTEIAELMGCDPAALGDRDDEFWDVQYRPFIELFDLADPVDQELAQAYAEIFEGAPPRERPSDREPEQGRAQERYPGIEGGPGVVHSDPRD